MQDLLYRHLPLPQHAGGLLDPCPLPLVQLLLAGRGGGTPVVARHLPRRQRLLAPLGLQLGLARRRVNKSVNMSVS